MRLPTSRRPRRPIPPRTCPALLQAALDYITTNKADRTDVWLLSDLQRSSWEPASGRWQTLRSAFSSMQGVRFHVLGYPQAAEEDLGVTVDRVVRRETGGKAELLLDLRIARRSAHPGPVDVPLQFVVNGTTTTAKVTLAESQLALQGYSIPIDQATKRGWGRVELPADHWASNNTFYFAFDEPPPLRSVIISDDEAESGPFKAALSAAADPARKYEATVLGVKRAAEIPWADTALIVWQAPIPKPGDLLANQLREFVQAGRSVLFLPPETPDATAIFGLHWEAWRTAAGGKPATVEWWRNDADLLANTRDGKSLPAGALEVARSCPIVGEGMPLARLVGHQPLLMRSSQEAAGSVYFLGTLSSPGSSSLARDGVVMFALLQRALNEGAATLGKAQQRVAGAAALGADPLRWHAAGQKGGAVSSTDLPLRAGRGGLRGPAHRVEPSGGGGCPASSFQRGPRRTVCRAGFPPCHRDPGKRRQPYE